MGWVRTSCRVRSPRAASGSEQHRESSAEEEYNVEDGGRYVAWELGSVLRNGKVETLVHAEDVGSEE